MNGIVEFRQHVLPNYREKFKQLALGQAPDTLFIACSDSRVVPNLFASTNPGDLFVVRNVGNLVPTFSSLEDKESAEAAAIEFSLSNLPIANVIVCGHSECGAMRAVTAGIESCSPPLKRWLCNCTCHTSDLENEPRIDHSLADHNQLSQLNILRQMEHLKTYPLVQEKIAQGALSIHGWYFDIAQADVYAYEEYYGRFVLIDEEESKRILSRML
ncbi:MAG: cynT [Chlamydiales bacterium]|nr:cynT [Chlamydiales bacterium]